MIQPNFMRMQKYLDKGFSWPQLMEIGWGIQNKLSDAKIAVYARIDLSYDKMRAYREAFENGATLEAATALSKMPSLYDWEIKQMLLNQDKLPQRNEQLDYWQQQQIRYAKRDNIDLTPYIAIGTFDWRQLKELRLGKQLKLDVTKYANAMFTAAEMRAIRENLEKEIDVTPYLRQGTFDKAQIREIRKGIIQKVAVKVYAKAELKAPQMRELRIGLAKGMEANRIAQIAATKLPWEQMREKITSEIEENTEEEEWEM